MYANSENKDRTLENVLIEDILITGKHRPQNE